MAIRSPYRRGIGRTWCRLYHFLWWYLGAEEFERREIVARAITLLGDGNLRLNEWRGTLPVEFLGHMAWEGVDVPIFGPDSPLYEAQQRLLDDALADLEPWGPRMTAWRAPGCKDKGDWLYPHEVLFPTKAACARALYEWLLEVELQKNPDRLGYKHPYPLSICDNVSARIPGVGGGENVDFRWKHEDVRVRLDTERDVVWTGSRSWFRAVVARQVEAHSPDGVPLGTYVAAKIEVGPWYPMQKDHNFRWLPDPAAEPDFMENSYPEEPIKEILQWAGGPAPLDTSLLPERA